LTEATAERNRQLAALEGKLQTTRQELSETQSKLAAAREQSLTQTGTIPPPAASLSPEVPPPARQ
jgi:hypothetical protein